MKVITEIQVDPKTPSYMDDRDIQKRSDAHLKKWLGVPFIITQTYEKEPYKKYVKRMSKCIKNFEPETLLEYEKRQFESHLQWAEWYKNHVRYDVRRLDGGAWDRTTLKGQFDNLADAIAHAQSLISED